MELNIQDWKEFKIQNIFELIRGGTLSSDDRDSNIGNIPCINGSAENNGELCRLNEEIDLPEVHTPALSLSRVGNSGITFFQPKDFYVADNAFGMKIKG